MTGNGKFSAADAFKLMVNKDGTVKNHTDVVVNDVCAQIQAEAKLGKDHTHVNADHTVMSATTRNALVAELRARGFVADIQNTNVIIYWPKKAAAPTPTDPGPEAA